ncbi:hypothetical protein HYX07_03245 [Candidatus Woesearchaeota archaeon]|nr:hypothetical protein [Candidatus Woesearchaeota archaeon]
MGKKPETPKKVEVINFPQKGIWDKLQIIATIAALIIAIISTSLYIYEINKIPDMEVSVFSPTPILGKTIFNFTNHFSKPLEFDISLINKGNKKSESNVGIEIVFNRKVNISLKPNVNWKESSSGPYYAFIYNNDLSINKGGGRDIGTFYLRIPKQNDDLLIAIFILGGDFERKTGLVYYDYINEKYIVKHYTNHTESIQIWNENIGMWNK